MTSIRPTVDQRYVFTMAYADLGAPTWSADLALTPTGDLMDGFDTPATEDTLDAMLLEGETEADRVTALIEYVSEIDAYVNGTPSDGTRHAAVEAAGR